MTRHQLCQGDCKLWLPQLCMDEKFDTIFADPPDNIGLGYGAYDDRMDDGEYADLLGEWITLFIESARTVWVSFNAKWTATVGAISLGLKDIEVKPCVQTFTFGQNRRTDLGNNHRPLWRFRQTNAPLYPDRIKVESWRQQHGDKRATPGGKVPSDVAEFERPDMLPLPNWTPQDIKCFLGNIDQKGADECWEWKGNQRAGYGRFKFQGKLYGATRLMWRLTYGTDPTGQLVCHSCDNPSCCNPSHLFLGTDADNNQDKEQKGRGNHPKGEDNGLAKLDESTVIDIFTSTESNRDLAAKYGVTDVTVRNIRDRKTWTHVTEKVDMGDVFRFPRVTGNSKQRRKWHPTQLNEGLVERCLNLTTPEHGRVCDPFAGTGTTLRVGKRLRFNTTLIELDPTYCLCIVDEHRFKLREKGKLPRWELDSE